MAEKPKDAGQTITELYSLRAGLSLIAQEGDRLNKQLADAQKRKELEIADARAETDAKISIDLAGVRLAEQQTESYERELKKELSRVINKLADKIADSNAVVEKKYEQAAEDADRKLAARKPQQDKDTYKDVRARYEKNQRDLKEKPSSYAAGDTAKCVFDCLFLALHALTAVYLGLGFIFDMRVWVRVVAVFVAIIIMAVECGMAHEDWIDYYDSSFEKYCGFAVLGYLGYLLNIATLIAVAFIGHPASSGYLGPTIAALIGAATALAVTIWRTVWHFSQGLQMEYLHRAQRKAENKKLEKQLKKADELDLAWAEYENARTEEIRKTVAADETDSQTEKKNVRTEINALKAETNGKIEKEKAVLAARKQAHEELKRRADDDYRARCESIEACHRDVCADLTAMHTRIASEMYDTLVKTFGKTLDVRDWRILDLVIWQLETGRADTIKEALQLADRETQTDRIVRTMESASEAIAQKLDEGFGGLQAQLGNGFYTLARGLAATANIISGQITHSSNILASKISESSQATAALYESQQNSMLETNRNLEQLFSQASLQTALLEKANSSSGELIAAVDKLRKTQQQ